MGSYQTTRITTDLTAAAQRIAALKQTRTKTLPSGYFKQLVVKFRSRNDADRFAKLIHQHLSIADKTIVFDPHRRGHGVFRDKPTRKISMPGISAFHRQHWVGMPEFVQDDHRWEWARVTVLFLSLEDYREFANIVRQFLKRTTTSIYYPAWTPATLKNSRWQSSLSLRQIQPRYPIYIISKGRSYSRLTSKALEDMNVPYFIVVEPSEREEYAASIDRRKILTLPSDTDPKNPTGPGRARNFCRDHAWKHGYRRHWVMDDNIEGFYRLHRNKRYKVADGAIFRAAEDFVDRYDNILVAGFNYRFFCASKSKYPPFVVNTRIYSCLLIDNTKLFRWKDKVRKTRTEKPVVIAATKGRPMSNGQFLWRERYNEDTILSLDSLENGFATVQFNAFLQGKSGTQQLRGGNTEVFYHTESIAGLSDKNSDRYHEAGTVQKSLTLEELYPEVARLVYRYSRPHHHVDYRKHRTVPLKRNPRIKVPEGSYDYGMELVEL